MSQKVLKLHPNATISALRAVLQSTLLYCLVTHWNLGNVSLNIGENIHTLSVIREKSFSNFTVAQMVSTVALQQEGNTNNY